MYDDFTINRRQFLAGGVAAATASVAGCFGYVTTDPDNYTVENAGFVGDDVYVDTAYHGSESGKVEYRLYIEQNGVHVHTTRVEARSVEPGQTVRFSVGDIATDSIDPSQNVSIGLILTSPKSGESEARTESHETEVRTESSDS